MITKTTSTLASAVMLALASTVAGAQMSQRSGHPGSSRDARWQSRAVALPQGPSAAEQAWFRRASRSWGGGY
ncbi:MAG: hypothetical protein JO000_31770 [Alphaproteobacteria bacterium]|nr:hypothetical protein [Alphaproteobacteria bacterium]